MEDYIIRATIFRNQARIFIATSTNLVSELQKRHKTTPVASAALGRVATLTAIMGIMLKGEEKITVQVAGNGPVGKIVVEANKYGQVRGYIDNPDVNLPLKENGKLDVKRAVGESGFIYIIRKSGLKEDYVSTSPIVSGEIGEDFAYYYTTSEQTPTAIGVGVLVNPDQSVLSAGAFLVQLLPGATEETITALENRISTMPPISKLIAKEETPEEILLKFSEENHIFKKQKIEFHCGCSKEAFAKGLITLGKEELTNMLKEEKIETKCHYCNSTYYFSSEEIKKIIELL